MRVLLFVQNEGDKRPKCVRGTIGFDPAEQPNYTYWLADSGFYGNWKQRDAVNDADSYWLVECESAEAGRRVLSHFERDRAEFPDASFESPFRYAEGVVLASGGKR